MIHELPLERRTLHGHFSRDLEPVLTLDSGDSVIFSTLDAGWHLELADEGPSPRFEPRDEMLDAGHALVGPIAVRGAVAGDTLAVTFDELRVGTEGYTVAGGWSTELNDFLGLGDGDGHRLVWKLDSDAAVGRDQYGREIALRPFLGVVGMPPAEPGVHSTGPPRSWGGNIDCAALVEGTTLYLPIPVDGGLLSAGDGHARQGDGEVSQVAIEAPMERVQLTLSFVGGLELENPVARIDGAWVALGFDSDLDVAAAQAVDGMLQLMGRELGLERQDALALASLVVDLRVTQIVNGVKGVHAVLRDDAIR